MMKIAVIGCAGYFPEAPDLRAFRTNLIAGRDSVRPISRERRRATCLPRSADFPEFAFLDDIHSFDHRFFNLSRGEASCMDPHQRLLLQTAHHAFESALMDGRRLRGSRTCVYVADVDLVYASLAERFDPTLLTGNLNAATAGRIARHFDLRGRALMIDTACSSALVAIEAACRELSHGEADYALVAAASLRVVPPDARFAVQAGLFSPSFRARSYSDEADGTGGGEAVGCVLLQRLDDARDERQIVHGVIHGAAVNQDAARSGSLTAPDAHAQAEVIEAAWAEAGIDPRTLRFIEGHGSATKLGDPIEVQGLTRAFRKHTRDREFCALSSVKSNIGHTDTAAGMAGFLKALLGIKHREIYPAVHFARPNALINFRNSPVYVNTAYRSLSDDAGELLGGVSSFGLSGTNAHVVLGSPPTESRGVYAPGWTPPPTPSFFALSAAHPEGLRDLAAGLLARIATVTAADLPEYGRALFWGRGHHLYRAAVEATDTTDLMAGLRAIAASDPTALAPVGQGAWIFCFSQSERVDARIVTQLRERYPVFAEACEAAGFAADDAADCGALNFVLQYGVLRLLQERGVAISTIVADGVGKEVAASVKGEQAPHVGLSRARGCLPAAPLSRQRLSALLEKAGPDAVFVEPGVLGHLSAALRETKSCTVLSLEEDEPFERYFSRLYRHGAAFEPGRFRSASDVDLPPYPFRKVRCWLREELPDEDSVAEAPAGTDWFAAARWVQEPAAPREPASLQSRTIVVIRDEAGLSTFLSERLRLAGATVVQVGVASASQGVLPLPDSLLQWRELFAQVRREHGALDGVMDLSAFVAPPERIDGAQAQAYIADQLGRRLAMIQSLTDEFARRDFRLTLVTAHANFVVKGDPVNPLAAMSAMLFRSLLSEYVMLDLLCMDAAFSAVPQPDLAQAIVREWMFPERIRFVSYRDGRRYAQLLEPVPAPAEMNVLEPGSIVLITGGAGGIALAIAEHLARNVTCHFILLGRRSAETLDPGTFLPIVSAGSTYEYHQADIADTAAVDALFTALRTRMTSITGVIHAAGVPGDWSTSIAEKTVADFQETAAGKVVGLLNLDRACAALSPAFFMAFSSLSVFIPPRHRADYACANAFLDAFAAMKAAKGEPFTVVNWPAWDESAMGMFDPSLLAASSSLRSEIAGQGFASISTGDALSAFDRLLGAGAGQTVLLRINRKALGFNPFFSLAPVGASSPVVALLPSEADAVEEKVWRIWAEILMTDQLGLDDDFYGQGGNSLIAVQIVHRLEEEFGRQIDLSDLLTAPTVRKLAQLVKDSRERIPVAGRIVRGPEQASYRVAGAQLRIWLASQRPGASKAFNEPSLYSIEGAVDAERLGQMFEKVVARHEVFRTAFGLVDGEVRQFVAAAVGRHAFFQALSSEQVAREWGSPEKLVREIAAQPFDLGEAPLLRVVLIHGEDRSATLVIVTHHIISDGWSHKVFVRELMDLYGHDGSAQAPAPLAIQYRDYAEWDAATPQRHAAHLEYWRSELYGICALRLPFDRRRPARPGYRGARVRVVTPPGLYTELQAFSKDRGIGTYALVLGVLGGLLYRWTGQEDFVIATPVSGRDMPEVASLAGCFVNLLCLRLRLDPEASLAELVKATGARLPVWLAHQDCPYELVFEDPLINPGRAASTLYQVGFTWDSDERHTFAIGDTTVRRLPLDNGTAKADLWFYGQIVDGELAMEIEYDTDLFAAETIHILAKRLAALLTEFHAISQRALRSLELWQPAAMIATADLDLSLELSEP